MKVVSRSSRLLALAGVMVASAALPVGAQAAAMKHTSSRHPSMKHPAMKHHKKHAMKHPSMKHGK
jgi:uncharacterized protein involved in copper resistance